jgi:hypothetical protein
MAVGHRPEACPYNAEQGEKYDQSASHLVSFLIIRFPKKDLEPAYILSGNIYSLRFSPSNYAHP